MSSGQDLLSSHWYKSDEVCRGEDTMAWWTGEIAPSLYHTVMRSNYKYVYKKMKHIRLTIVPEQERVNGIFTEIYLGRILKITIQLCCSQSTILY